MWTNRNGEQPCPPVHRSSSLHTCTTQLVTDAGPLWPLRFSGECCPVMDGRGFELLRRAACWPLSTHSKTGESLNSNHWWSFCICAHGSSDSHLHFGKGARCICSIWSQRCFNEIPLQYIKPSFDSDKRLKSNPFHWLTFMGVFFPLADVRNCWSH